ncbi:D-alanyl-D-alanine carboxypeptidase (penicillin-binding protein 5/6) [Terracoccus luteus]|uniref:D-alanyl-D-alanine carboxypeptidase (Penicillin-binding protein 5/6) n=1 Tax=Terracoccus luteus TaxID=53356 RepID=A0A495XUR8_9MICO|nr:D-alanyl-D-alanine carboxypeptidase [Terracoccus luteus]RKT78290.1 D-alanyl-D-alanine carboxypeptidase (penicillin-binding protein 5/6) [Terracoccus luteus]
MADPTRSRPLRGSVAPHLRARAALVIGTVAGLTGLVVPAAVTAPAASASPPAAALVVAAPALAPAADPTCRPWQTPTRVPGGVTLTPRVFPTPSVGVAPKPTPRPAVTTPRPAGTTSPGPRGSSAPAPPPRTVCRNAPPTPFTHPAWDPQSVVGGPRLGGDGVLTDLPDGVPAPPAVYDVSYVVADLTSGEILAAKSPHAWLRPASTLKTLTALTLLPRLDPRRTVVAGPDAQRAAGTRVGILAGNPYPVGSLFDALLMFSANDAAYVLADAAGGYERTVTLMNERATALGAHDTLTVDPSGLDEGAQRSSAYDLAVIARAAMRLPAFRATVARRTATFPGGKDRTGRTYPAFEIHTINDLLDHYPGAVGIKPGRTDRAQHTFIGAATRGGRTLVVAQMGSVTGAWQPTAALLDWGFAHADRVRPVGRLVEPGEAAPPRADAPDATDDTTDHTTADAGSPRPPTSGPTAPVATRSGAGGLAGLDEAPTGTPGTSSSGAGVATTGPRDRPPPVAGPAPAGGADRSSAPWAGAAVLAVGWLGLAALAGLVVRGLRRRRLSGGDAGS